MSGPLWISYHTFDLRSYLQKTTDCPWHLQITLLDSLDSATIHLFPIFIISSLSICTDRQISPYVIVGGFLNSFCSQLCFILTVVFGSHGSHPFIDAHDNFSSPLV